MLSPLFISCYIWSPPANTVLRVHSSNSSHRHNIQNRPKTPRPYIHLSFARQKSHIPIPMFAKLTSAVTSLSLSSPSTPKPGPSHSDPARISTYITLAEQLRAADVPVSSADDCARCDAPCSDSDDAQSRGAANWDGQTYDDYVLGRYGELGGLPFEKEVDWDTELAGSSQGGRGRVVVISTGKSDWVRDHTVRLYY